MLISNIGAFIGYISFGYVNFYLNHFKLSFSLYAGMFALGLLVFVIGTSLGNISVGLSLLGLFIVGLGTGYFSGYGPLYSKIFPLKIRNMCSSFCFNMG